jgi:hypothetical protein
MKKAKSQVQISKQGLQSYMPFSHVFLSSVKKKITALAGTQKG